MVPNSGGQPEMSDSTSDTLNAPNHDPEFLNPIQVEILHYVERHHASHGVAPTDEIVKHRFDGIDDDFMTEFKANPLVLKSCAARGIIYPTAEDRFTAKQLAAVSAMLSYTDKRSDEKKLRDLGITTREWSGWLQDNEFAEYLRVRSERMMDHSMHEAHLGLIKGIRGGNASSIKLYYEMTGRHDPDKEAQINVRLLLSKFIEVLQRHIKDPVLLNSIAIELTNLASRESFGQALERNIIQGQINR